MASLIRDHDWGGTPLGSIGAWSERLKLMIEQVLASPLVSSLVCGPERILVYNDAAARLYGDRHPGALGQPLPKTFPDTWPVVASLYDHVFSGESVHVPAQPLDLRENEIFDAYLTPLRDEAGGVIAAHMVGFEISDRLRAEAALRESEERLARALEGGDVGAWELDLVTLKAWRSPQHDRIFGYKTLLPEWTYDVFLSHVAPEDRGWVDARFQDAIATDRRWNFECRIRRADGRPGWIGAQGRIDVGAGGCSRRMKGTVRDITERKQGESLLRESEERQAFLLLLSDALRPLSDPAEIQHAAMKLLAEKYDVMRAGYLDVHADGDTMTMAAHYERDAVPAPPQIRLFDYGPDLIAAFHAGHTRHVRDTIAEAETEEQRAAYRVLGVYAWIIAPLVKDGRLIAIVGVVSKTPRDWTPIEIQLVTDLAERTWDAVQRARSETALRESEERFAQFANSSSDTLWIRDGATLAMEYVSPATQETYGVLPSAILGDVERWAGLIVPEDRNAALAQLELARQGKASVHEFRVRRPSDGEVRWIKNTDFPLHSERGCVQRVGGIAVDVTDAKRAADRQDVLINELQHRARNLLAVVRAIAGRTVTRGGSVAAFEVRLQALSRAQALLSQAGSDKVEVGALIRAELAAHADNACERTTVSGPEVHLTAQQVQNFALAVHELTTNAVKYGALQDGTGHLAVTWEVVLDRRERRRLALNWVESGVTIRSEAARRHGYGTELIQEALVYALEARVDYELSADGVRCRIEMPVT
ncbi:PAS domain-containing protein [Methylobacterium mesophilicum SR1.6/6]|uniref:Blue-light-activated histidine kinase n=1 Tax=Methylobacterium mesophilicum SR1.6/6 TaxID=908290 RepID=A0A6B9FK91_9HYPH|nr:PAS domain-containing protein [Methylobacterium mesophilicum]QGY01564.1 PAS domain-containing protein [Methylobacterium mesophilicum SR1.6/6]